VTDGIVVETCRTHVTGVCTDGFELIKDTGQGTPLEGQG
jgi:hypothetical protein